MKVLLLGSGGREHALAWKINQSERLTKLYVAPGNAGTAEIAENVNIKVTDFEALATFVEYNAIDMLVVGPEDPLVEGIRDYFEEVMGLDNIYANSKEALALSWKERHPNVQAVMIGDTVHDYEVAKAMNVDCVLIAGGHQPKETLLRCDCLVLDHLNDFCSRF